MAILLLLILFSPHTNRHCDKIELKHVYLYGNYGFSQLIYYDWHKDSFKKLGYRNVESDYHWEGCDKFIHINSHTEYKITTNHFVETHHYETDPYKYHEIYYPFCDKAWVFD